MRKSRINTIAICSGVHYRESRNAHRAALERNHMEHEAYLREVLETTVITTTRRVKAVWIVDKWVEIDSSISEESISVYRKLYY